MAYLAHERTQVPILGTHQSKVLRWVGVTGRQKFPRGLRGRAKGPRYNRTPPGFKREDVWRDHGWIRPWKVAASLREGQSDATGENNHS